MRDRAYRRWQEQRHKARTKRLLRLMQMDASDPRVVGHWYATHRKPCSCAFCGNPRRHFGEPTVQEKNTAAKALLEEWLADESGYDEQAWPIVERALAEAGEIAFDIAET